jgi:DUF1365 family protein
MRSRIYECHIVHTRLHPRVHRFAYRLFMLALDLDELTARAARRFSLLRIDRPGLLSIHQRDYLPTHDPLHNASPSAAPSLPAPSSPLPALKARVLAHLASLGIPTPPDARVLLLTLPRVLGYQFNPVSFYFISAPDLDAPDDPDHDTPVACIAEVTNTFRETKLFVLGPDTLARSPRGPLFHLHTPKHFYVSPFSDVDLAFDFRLRPPTDRLALQIDDYEGERRMLISTVTESAPPRPLRDRTLAWFSLKYPFVTLKVIAAIHWEALRLYLKRVPWFAKAARPADQRDLHHPHASLVPPRQP